MKLLVDAGTVCAAYQSQTFRNLPCLNVQADEIWSFVYAKQKNTPDSLKDKSGDIWTWVAMCADTKLVPVWRVGKREADVAHDFMKDLASRLDHRIQLTTDGFRPYVDAVEAAWGPDVDYAMQLPKYMLGSNADLASTPVGVCARRMSGSPDPLKISTSYVERQNFTMRMHMRRYARKTNGFSKKPENHIHATALYFMYYNFIRLHKSLQTTPAMAAGVSGSLLEWDDVIDLMDRHRSEARTSESVAPQRLQL